MNEFTVGDGRYQVTLKLEEIPGGLWAGLFGGDLSHVGAVVLANPRSSLSGEGESCDLWTLHLPGHLDHLVAEPMARRLCTELQIPISLTVGIHLDNATQQEIELMSDHCETLTEMLLEIRRTQV
ncbi:MAG: hypothetical protein FWF91_07765 [Coriobacteriia bacterium]|nr:hypothetical protein [Coriobacteriia bacterium]